MAPRSSTLAHDHAHDRAAISSTTLAAAAAPAPVLPAPALPRPAASAAALPAPAPAAPRPAAARTAVAAVAGLGLITAAGGCSDDEPRGPAGERVILPGDAFYPEGVAIDRDGRTFVSSIFDGSIVRIERGASEPSELVAPGALGTSTVGLAMSRADDLLWACDGTFGSETPPSIIGVDPDTGAERVRHRFPPQQNGRTGGFCNELTEDDAGNLYASDSFGARVIRVLAADRTTPDRAAVWAQGPELAAPLFGINGIAYDGAGAILAVNSEANTLYRIALADASITPVTLSRSLNGPDGIRLAAPGRAIVVEQPGGTVSSIDLATGAITVLREGLRQPTSLDVSEEAAWVSEGQLRHIFDGTPPGLPFEVVRVAL